MENKAQVSFEYLVLITLLIVMGTLIATLANQYFTMAGGTRQTANMYKDSLINMVKG